MIQFLTFASIGVWNTVFDIFLWKSFLFLQIAEKLNYKKNSLVLAQYFSFSVASIVSFCLNLFLTFGSQKYDNLVFVGIKFGLATWFFAYFSGWILSFLHYKFPKSKQLFLKLLTVCFTLPLTYFVYKFGVYV